MADNVNPLIHLKDGIPDELPEMKILDESVDHAPARKQVLTNNEKKTCIKKRPQIFSQKISFNPRTRVFARVGYTWKNLHAQIQAY